MVSSRSRMSLEASAATKALRPPRTAASGFINSSSCQIFRQPLPKFPQPVPDFRQPAAELSVNEPLTRSGPDRLGRVNQIFQYSFINAIR